MNTNTASPEIKLHTILPAVPYEVKRAFGWDHYCRSAPIIILYVRARAQCGAEADDMTVFARMSEMDAERSKWDALRALGDGLAKGLRVSGHATLSVEHVMHALIA